MCHDWQPNDGQASERDWTYARQIYKESNLNQNRIALYDLTLGYGLKLEIEWKLLTISSDEAQLNRYLGILRTIYKEVNWIADRISQYVA